MNRVKKIVKNIGLDIDIVRKSLFTLKDADVFICFNHIVKKFKYSDLNNFSDDGLKNYITSIFQQYGLNSKKSNIKSTVNEKKIIIRNILKGKNII